MKENGDIVRSPLLRGLIDERGFGAGERLVRTLIDEDGPDALLFLGPGGSGKTTILAAVVHEAVSRVQEVREARRGQGGESLPFLAVQYFQPSVISTRLADRIKISREHWTDREWNQNSSLVYDELNVALERAAQCRTPDKRSASLALLRWVFVADLIAVGKLNKGRTVVEKLAPRGKVEFAVVVGDYLNAERAVRVREKASSASPEELEQILAADHMRVHIQDRRRLPQVLSQMGTKELIESLRGEIDEEVKMLEAAGSIDPAWVRLPSSLVEAIAAQEEKYPYLVALHEGRLRHFRREAAYLEFRACGMGITGTKRRSARTRFLYNVFDPGMEIDLFQDDLDKAAYETSELTL